MTEFSPLIAEACKNTTVEEGDEAQFEVRLASMPEPQVMWYKDGAPIGPELGSPKYKFYYRTRNHSHTRGIVISDVKHSDVGQYEVRAWNKLGHVSCSASLNVEGDY